ncbi:type I-B CRISPR-associated protein Cas7/Cst2/DevR [Desulfocurvibacter africanus]|uniref:type I-B CRISPR-associated protein Cas7/Cst2/DevR n=1 Tax=Desulfocurvibacter africanus TaxID=873 RepID=UPI002FDA9D43
MAIHIFGMILTHQGTFANNRGENEGNATTLQKVFRKGELYTTVSAESIRYALREHWQAAGESLNRVVEGQRSCSFCHREFNKWHENLDDDVLGFMHAQKDTLSRRGILEITRAVSLTPWRGEIMHNFATAGSNPAVSTSNPIPYAVEVHDTRYHYGFALTPEYFGREGLGSEDTLSFDEKASRLAKVLSGLASLRRVGGNHARYFADYSPEAIVLRVTDDPAPRFLYCFAQDEVGNLSLEALKARVEGEDIKPSELIIGSSLNISGANELESLGATIHRGVMKAVEEAVSRFKGLAATA